MKHLATAAVVVLACGTVLAAHHSYTAFDQNRSVTVTGTIERVRFGNPHVVLSLRVADAQSLTVSWASAYQLAYAGVTAKMVAVGDQLTVTGSPALDPDRHEITLLRTVESPVRGWRWEGGRLARFEGREQPN